MKYKETTKVLQDFAREVIRGAKQNLQKRNASGKLSRSLKSDVKVNPKSFELDFEMEGYGQFQDAGVDGKKKKYGKRKAGLPTYSFKSKMPPPKSLDKWVVKRGLKGTRDAKGRFVKRQSLTFLIARSIFIKGLEPTYFFTNAFEAAYKKLPKEFIDKYELDIDNFLKFTTK
jgi:hypothetical protein|tara:strand:+ start:897 stop:1412 length:516 start_codon:yes stop_codon:yes gene_type:complete